MEAVTLLIAYCDTVYPCEMASQKKI